MMNKDSMTLSFEKEPYRVAILPGSRRYGRDSFSENVNFFLGLNSKGSIMEVKFIFVLLTVIGVVIAPVPRKLPRKVAPKRKVKVNSQLPQDLAASTKWQKVSTNVQS